MYFLFPLKFLDSFFCLENNDTLGRNKFVLESTDVGLKTNSAVDWRVLGQGRSVSSPVSSSVKLGK